jgi:CSLREA domain-containing protein
MQQTGLRAPIPDSLEEVAGMKPLALARVSGATRPLTLLLMVALLFSVLPAPAAQATWDEPLQSGPTFTVNTQWENDDVCGISNCSLREAIKAANAAEGPNTIVFNLPRTHQKTIKPFNELPAITGPTVIDATTQPGYKGTPIIELEGLRAGKWANGLVLAGGDTVVRGLAINRFAKSGILITSDNNAVYNTFIGVDRDGTKKRPNKSDGITIKGGSFNVIGDTAGGANRIAFNDGAGVYVESGVGNAIRGNSIFENKGLGIDLGDSGANNQQAAPVLLGVTSDGTAIGTLTSTANSVFAIDVYASPKCDTSGSGEGRRLLGAGEVATNASGEASFVVAIGAEDLSAQQITAVATAADGSSSEFSACVSGEPIAVATNDSWQTATPIALSPDPLDPNGALGTASQFLLRKDQVAWFKFDVTAGAQVEITLDNLVADYDLILYDDIQAAKDRLNAVSDPLDRGLQVAPVDIGPVDIGPVDIGPVDIGPVDIGPVDIGPVDIGPVDIGPVDIGPVDIGPVDIGDAASANAQISSLRAISALPGIAGERIVRQTWNNNGDMYLRVRGKDGVFSTAAPFQLNVALRSAFCAAVSPVSSEIAPTLAATAGGYRTLILTNMARMRTTASGAAGEAEVAALNAQLATLAARTDGVIVDVGADARVQAAQSQADALPACPYAKNLLADEIKRIVDDYRALNGELEFLVLLGDDRAIPDYRLPDNSGVEGGLQSDFAAAVREGSPLRAANALNLIRSQEPYGASTRVTRGSLTFLSADLSVGRLVETAWEATQAINAYLATPDGALRPNSALLTGYDFFNDVRAALEAEFEAGTGVQADFLEQLDNLGPNDPGAWSSEQLRELLFEQRHDLIFLGAHASPESALAADYDLADLLQSRELQTRGDFSGSLVISIGCHLGYSIPGEDALYSGDDWAQDFLARGATVVAATTYQFGDTDFIEYGERLYLELARQLRADTGAPIALGTALKQAKANYLAATPVPDGIHEKTLLSVAILGLPMYGVDFANRSPASVPASIVDGGTPTLSEALPYADVDIAPTITLESETVGDIENPGATVAASYFSGENGAISAIPGEPVLPLVRRNVGVSGKLLRGALFLGGSYSEQGGQRALTAAPAIERSAFNPIFFSDVLFPARFWTTSLFAARDGGPTWLNLNPAQFRSQATGATSGKWRSFSDAQFRLFYAAENATAPLAAPQIVRVDARPADGGAVNVSVDVQGNTADDIRQVVVTYTADCAANATCSGEWRSIFLSRGSGNTWTGNFTPDFSGTVVLFVQAVNSGGLVGINTNSGEFYTPQVPVAVPPGGPLITQLEFIDAPSGGPLFVPVTLSARLTQLNPNQALAGRRVLFTLGSQQAYATTGSDGVATITLRPRDDSGETTIGASFVGNPALKPVAISADFQIGKRTTSLAYVSNDAITITEGQAVGADVQLLDQSGRPLVQRGIYYVANGGSGSFPFVALTDGQGFARLDSVELAAGSYTLTAYYNGNIPGIGLLEDQAYAASQTGGRTLIVNPAPGEAPQIVSPPVTNGGQGQPYSYRVVATGTPQPGYTLVDAPSGMIIDAQSGVIFWTPIGQGSYKVTVQATNGVPNNATQTFTIVVGGQPSAQKVSPVLECVRYLGPGNYVARFGYNNPNSYEVGIALGADNKFTPAPENRGQPTLFAPGRQVKVFEVPFDGSNLVWTLNGKTATASSNPAQRCDDSVEEPQSGLVFSLRNDRSNPAALAGATLKGEVFIYYTSSESVRKVRFFLNRTDGNPFNNDYAAPFDFVNTPTGSLARPYRTSRLSNGQHTIYVTVFYADGRVVQENATFTIAN